MLRSLRIRNLVIVDDLTVEFGPGLNLLTGETGAGKSILIDALGLVLGARAERSAIRSGRDRATVEALFDVEPGSRVWRWAIEQGLDGIEEDRQIAIRRQLPVSGNGRAWINGTVATLSALREVGALLLEIHGQHEQQTLLSTGRHLELLDRFGGHLLELERVDLTHAAVVRSRARREELSAAAAERAATLARLESIVREIEAVAPRPGEMDELDAERRRLRNAAGLTSLLAELTERLDDGGAVEQAAVAGRRAAAAAELDPTLLELAERLRSAALELEDLGEAFHDYRRRHDFDPSRLEELEARRAAIEELLLHYGADEQAVLDRRDDSRAELESLEQLDAELAAAAAAVACAEAEYVAAAVRLSRARAGAVKRLRVAVERQFQTLALGKARFDVALGEGRGESVAGATGAVTLSAHGAERAEFLLAANPGEPFRPLQRVASGGELSRLMLALHAVIESSGEGRVLVFDEVDSGVGGAVADAVGARLAGLARHGQVLCVTHLPQVAAYASGHFVVRKRVIDRRTQAEIRRLDPAGRIEELARMLGGKQSTETSRRHATELLGAARDATAPAAVGGKAGPSRARTRRAT